MTARAEQKRFAASDETREFERGTLDLLRIGGAEIGLAHAAARLALVRSRQAARGYRPVRGAALPVPRAGSTARGHGRRFGVRRPARRCHRAPPGPRRLGGRRRAGRGGRLVRRQQLRPELRSANGSALAEAQSAKPRAGTPVTSRTVEVTVSGWVTNRSQVSRADAANPGSPQAAARACCAARTGHKRRHRPGSHPAPCRCWADSCPPPDAAPAAASPAPPAAPQSDRRIGDDHVDPTRRQ